MQGKVVNQPTRDCAKSLSAQKLEECNSSSSMLVALILCRLMEEVKSCKNCFSKTPWKVFHLVSHSSRHTSPPVLIPFVHISLKERSRSEWLRTSPSSWYSSSASYCSVMVPFPWWLHVAQPREDIWLKEHQQTAALKTLLLSSVWKANIQTLLLKGTVIIRTQKNPQHHSFPLVSVRTKPNVQSIHFHLYVPHQIGCRLKRLSVCAATRGRKPCPCQGQRCRILFAVGRSAEESLACAWCLIRLT